MALARMGAGRQMVLAFALAACLPGILSAEEPAEEGVVVAMMSASDRIDMLPGQAVIFVPDGGKMTFIRFVKGPMQPEAGELKLEFGALGGQSSLIVTSKADKAYQYRAQIVKTLGAKKGKPTSVCTIIAGGGAFETWPNAIPVLRVMDFKPAADGAVVCR